MTRVHAEATGSYWPNTPRSGGYTFPIQAIPKLVTNAFISAEDKNFYEHPGV